MLRMKPMRRRRRARRAARVLDELVDAQAPLLPELPENRQASAADYLAELAHLADTYRYYADGWIDRAELEQRGATTVSRLNRLRTLDSREYTERD